MHSGRITGFDLARAIAIFGMVLVNYKIVMGAVSGPDWMIWGTSLIEGRAAAMFVILAGVGIALMTRSSVESGDAVAIKKDQNSLLIRAVLLVVLGLSYSPIWPADILHFYGFYIGISAFLFMVPNRNLWVLSVTFVIGWLVLNIPFNYEAGWNWDTLEYSGFWTASGMLRHIFFNGFHPVFPWAAFLFIGIWLGRQNVANAVVRKKIFIHASLVAIGTEVLSKILIQSVETVEPVLVDLVKTGPMPPMPQYIFAGAGTAVAVIMFCIHMAQKLSENQFIAALVKTGQLSLTFYVAHVIIGMGILESMGLLYHQSIEMVWVAGLTFNVSAIVFAVVWKSKFNTGPLEWVFKKLAS